MTSCTLFIVLNALIVITMTQSPTAPSNTENTMYKDLTASCNDFAKTFYKELSFTSEGNIVSSPLSIHMILSLLSHGAESETLGELTIGLCHYNKDSIKEAYASLIPLLNELKDIKLYIANAIYLQDGFEVLTEFLTVGVDIYRSMISKLDFNQNVVAADKINTWIKETTDNKILSIVSADDFDEYSKLVLVNAIYFSGIWLHKFDLKKTEKKEFYMTKTEKKMVPTMFSRANYNCGKIPTLDATFIEIPYMNKDIVMTIILPNEMDGLLNLQNNFSWETLASAHRYNYNTELYLPKFKIELTVDLEKILNKLGLNKLFKDTADFNRISKEDVKVSKVLHKAMIEVNEEGTEAAAATAVRVRLCRMASRQYFVDHPFMFIIEHKPSNVPLFIGCIKDIEVTYGKDEL